MVRAAGRPPMMLALPERVQKVHVRQFLLCTHAAVSTPARPQKRAAKKFLLTQTCQPLLLHDCIHQAVSLEIVLLWDVAAACRQSRDTFELKGE